MREPRKWFRVLGIALMLAIPASARAATWTFSNPAPITIPDASAPSVECSAGPGSVMCRPASPYPSPIEVSVAGGTITDVEATITDLTHQTQSLDLAVVLSGPPTMQRSLMLMNCAGDQPLQDLALTFDDAATSQLPSIDPVTSGTWRPTSHCTGDAFPSPGPGTTHLNPGPVAGGTATLASAFGNRGPNGQWGLYIVDFNNTQLSGSIAGGWSIEIETSGPAEPTLNATHPPSPSNENEVNVIGSAPAGTTVTLYDACPFLDAGATEVGSGTAAELASPGIPVSVADDSDNTYFAMASEAGVGGSNCSNGLDYIEDSTPPETELTKVPPNRSHKRRPKFEFEADELQATFKCRLDDAQFKPCESPKRVKVKPGRHTFTVAATDAAGNPDPVPAQDEFKVLK